MADALHRALAGEHFKHDEVAHEHEHGLSGSVSGQSSGQGTGEVGRHEHVAGRSATAAAAGRRAPAQEHTGVDWLGADPGQLSSSYDHTKPQSHHHQARLRESSSEREDRVDLERQRAETAGKATSQGYVLDSFVVSDDEGSIEYEGRPKRQRGAKGRGHKGSRSTKGKSSSADKANGQAGGEEEEDEGPVPLGNRAQSGRAAAHAEAAGSAPAPDSGQQHKEHHRLHTLAELEGQQQGQGTQSQATAASGHHATAPPPVHLPHGPDIHHSWDEQARALASIHRMVGIKRAREEGGWASEVSAGEDEGDQQQASNA